MRRRTRRCAAFAVVAFGWLGLASAGGARAETFVVDSQQDGVDAAPGDGACATAAGACTLRAAVQESNARPGADEIDLPPGLYVLDSTAAPEEDASAAGDLDVLDDLTIVGAGIGSTFVSSGGDGGPSAERAFHVLAGGLDVSGVEIRGRDFRGADGGGAIYNRARARLVDCVLDGRAKTGIGGAVRNDGDLTLTRVFVYGEVVDNPNESGGAIVNIGTLAVDDATINGAGSGGIVTNHGTATFARTAFTRLSTGQIITNPVAAASLVVTDSVISGGFDPSGFAPGLVNYGAAQLVRTTVTRNRGLTGGGIYNAGTLEVRDSTVSDNEAFQAGGGIYNGGGTLTVVNSTISGNVADYGAGISNEAGTLRLLNATVVLNDSAPLLGQPPGGVVNRATAILANTVLAGNTSRNTFPDPRQPVECGGAPFVSAGHNLVQAPGGCSLVGDTATDVLEVDPLLGPLAANGGPTETHAPLPGSPTIDAGNPAAPGSGGDACPVDDQRGSPRPQASACDIGAVEAVVCGDGTVGLGEACDDGNQRDGDCCAADCRQRTSCPACERCDEEAGACVAALRPQCRVTLRPSASRLTIVDADVDGHDRFDWRWKGEATTVADFGDPTNGTGYLLCAFVDGAPSTMVAFAAATRPGLWSATGTRGFAYADPASTPSGLSRLLLKAGAAGAAKLVVLGRGANLALPALPLGLPVRVQLQSDTGACWEARYAPSGVRRNTTHDFSGKSSGPDAP